MKFKKIPFNVLILGIVSFFNDLSSEMAYPIVPIFLTSVLHAPISVVGLIEGIAEGSASIFKFLFGYMSDKSGKRKIFVIGGYGFAAFSKILVGIATVWPFVLFARFVDRLGKGMRTSARDSLLLQNTTETDRGYIFGFHKAMDSLGAIFGPLIALFLLVYLKDNLRLIFLLAVIPSVVSIILLYIFVKEKTHAKKDIKSVRFSVTVKNLHPKFILFFVISMIFALGNSSDAFLILRAKDLGLTTTLTVLVYVLYNVSQTVFATPIGSLSDKIGARRVYAMGLIIFSVVYFLFAWITNPFWLWFIFPFYGLYIAFTEGISKAYISQFITETESGTYFGLYLAGSSICTFFASLIGGLLWSQFGSSATFYYGSVMAILAFLVLSYGKLIKI